MRQRLKSAYPIAAHMVDMTSFINVFTPEPKPPVNRLHSIQWFIEDGSIDFTLSCLDEPLGEPYRCDCEAAAEDKSSFLMGYVGDRAPLVDGEIVSYWEQTDNGELPSYELSWRYATIDERS